MTTSAQVGLLVPLSAAHAQVVHHFRARMHFQMAQQYRETVWDSMKLPRKFFIKYRGLGPAHGRGDLPAFRALYLRAALASASRYHAPLLNKAIAAVIFDRRNICLFIGR